MTEWQEFPLSIGQRALWFMQQLDPGSVAHNVVHALQLRASADLNALQQAWQLLVDRHPMLRTSFHDRLGEPVQRVHSRAEVRFSIVNAAQWTDSAMEAALADQLHQPFDLKRGPLLRVVVFSRARRNPIMLTALHHIVTDLWSLAIMLSELTQFYQALVKGTPAGIRPLKSHYIDYVTSHADMIAGPEGERLWRYWRERLAGAHPPLDLPKCENRPAARTDRGEAIQAVFSGQLTEQLDRLARSRKTTLSTLVMAAFLVLLHRYTGQTQFCIGTTKAGRTHKTARVVGYFINPVVLKTDVSGDPTFTDYLSRVQSDTERDFKHDAFPFPLLVERLAPVRDMRHPPFFQVMFAWQKTTSAVEKSAIAAITIGQESQRAEVGDLVAGPVFIRRRATPFDWGVWAAESESGGQKSLLITLEYVSGLYEADTIRRVLSNFEILLEAVVENPVKRISVLALLSEKEKRLISGWQVPDPGPVETSKTVQALIAEQAEKTPAVNAIFEAGRALTYRELDIRANRLAHHLLRLGVTPESCVGVCLQRSIEAIVSMLAVLKAGGVYLPLDPLAPPDRLVRMLEDSQAVVLITEGSLAQSLPGAGPEKVLIDRPIESIPVKDDKDPGIEVDPLNAAYAIYTSGSTGTPKAVVIPHGQFAAHCVQMAAHYRLAPSDRVLQFAALNFDASVEQIVPTLIAGASLVLMDPGVWTPIDFQRKVNELELSVVNLPPAYFQQMAQEWKPDLELNPATLRLIIVGGDVFPPAVLNLWGERRQRPVCLLNAYGPTETTVTATTQEIKAPEGPLAGPARVPIGRPLPGRKACILDRYGNQVPMGATGELHLGGIGIARGYLGRPDRTAESFIPDAFGATPGARLYRTGDLARYGPDGSIEVLGRIDHQVKIRGFRIELGEIEAALARNPDIKDAVVDVRQDATGDPQMVGYVVARRPGVPSKAELKRFLKKHLPDYMIPSIWVPLEALPMASSGKVDRKSLPPPESVPTEPAEGHAGPRTATEEELAGMWAEVFGIERVGIHDNFFDLGGHSLKATQLISRIREAFVVELPLRSLFDSPTVAGLAALVEERLIAEESDEELNRMLAELEGAEDEDAGPGSPKKQQRPE
jgi:amino acid adenylation domain-containing protein